MAAALKTRQAKIVRAAEVLVAHWKQNHDAPWYHRGHWYPMGSERFAKALINAVLTKEKKRG